MADLGEEAYSSQMKVIATFLRLLEELMRNKQQDLRYGTKTQRRGIFRRMKDFVGGVFKKVYDGTFGRLSRNGKDYGQLDLNDPAVAKLFADTMKQMGMDTMHEDNNLLFSTSDIAKIMAFSKMVEQELGKKIEHENDTPEKEQSQEHGQDHEKQADARDWSDYPATPEQIELTATVLAADEGVSIDEIKKDFSENPSIGELQIALEAKGHDTMAIQPDLRNYATPEQRAQLDMGNMFQESGCRPTAINPSSGAYGICQWLGGRKTGLENLAKQKGKDMSDLSVQLDWFWDEFAESCSGWNKAKYKVFCAQSDLKQCVYLFRSQFERCGESEAADANRLAQAQRIYDALGTSNGTNGIDGNGQDLKKATRRQKDVVNAANTTTSPGQGWCAAWVTNVFQNAGIGYFGGNACDMCRAYCTSTNVRDLKVGMIIADVSHPEQATRVVFMGMSESISAIIRSSATRGLLPSRAFKNLSAFMEKGQDVNGDGLAASIYLNKRKGIKACETFGF